MAHGLRAGAHRRRQTLGCTRRHPRPGQRNIQGEQPRNPLGGAFQGRTGPDRRQGDGEGQGREKGVSGIGRSGHEPHEYRWRHDGRLHRQEPQLRGLLRGRSRRRDQSTHSYRAQDERDDGRLVRQGLAGPAAGRGASAAAGRTVRPLRPQHPLLEHHRPAARELPQLRPAAGPLRQSTADVQRRERDDALRDQKHPLGVHPPQRRPVHLRKSRQPLRPVHDRRISGHLDPGVGKLPAPAGQRHGTVGTDLGADRGRHQTVDLPLAGRRLGDPAPPGGTGAGRSEHRNDTPEGEFPELAAGGGVQQPDDRQGGRKRQHGTEPTARPGSAARPGGKGPGRAARHPAGGLSANTRRAPARKGCIPATSISPITLASRPSSNASKLS